VTRRRRPHAAARARVLTAVVSVVAFVGIGQAIDIASHTSTTAGTVAAAQRAVSPSLSTASQGSASVSAASQRSTTTAVTTTHAS
jgi:hypothetical protein